MENRKIGNKQEPVTRSNRFGFYFGSIRTRLLIIFVLLVLLPALTVGAASAIGSWQSGKRQVKNQLEGIAVLKQQQIESWLRSLDIDLNFELVRESAPKHMGILLQGAPDTSDFQVASDAQLARFRQSIELRKNFEELFLMNRKGEVILSTDANQGGKLYSTQAFFKEGLKDFFVQPPLYSVAHGRVLMVVARPVMDEGGQVLGVLAGRVGMARLSDIMGERTGLGDTGETYLVGGNKALLTELRFTKDVSYVRTQGTSDAIENQTEGFGIYDDYQGLPVVGVYRWLPELQVALMAEQDQAEAFDAVYDTLGIITGIVLAAVLSAAILGVFVTRGIANPLSDLAATTQRIAAGKLTARVERITSRDEIGVLATSFNAMADRVSSLLTGLEERSRALETSARVSRRLSTILNQEQLVTEVVTQVQGAFGYYHAHIYLLDATGEYLVMAGGTGEAGRAMLAGGHKIPWGKGLVGRAAETRETVLVPDVSQEEGWLPNPLLPDTRAEIAVPIVAGERVLGVLDVQHNLAGGLDQSDADLLSSIAGQAAVALQNTRLFAQTQQRAEYEARLNQISQRIQSTTTVESALQIAVREVGQALGAPHTQVKLETAAAKETNGREANRL